MKIIQVNKFNYLRGGAEKYFLDLSDALAGQGHQVAKFCMDHPKNLPSPWSKYFVSRVSFNDPRCSKIKAALRIFYSREAKRQFDRLIRDFRPDIIHIHNIYHQISPSILSVARKHKIPVAMHLHDYKLMCPNYVMYNSQGVCERCQGHKYYNCTKYRCLKGSLAKSVLATLEMYLHHSLLRIYEKNISVFLSPSRFLKNKAAEWGFDSQKFIFLPNFIETENLKPDYRLGKYLLYFGRFSFEKGVSTLIEALPHTRDQAIKLKIVGTGAEENNYRALIEKMSLSDRVEIIPAKYGEELFDCVRGAHAVVVPSVWYENWPISILEAAALGKIVIGSRIGGIPEMVKEGETGFLSAPGDAAGLAAKIDELSAGDHSALAQAARQSVRQFNLKDHLKKINDIYSSLAK